MTAVQPAYVCNEAEARDLTEQIKSSVEKTWRLLLNAHEWKAWAALGYGSWRDYATSEFGISQSRAYQLLDAAKVVREIEGAAGFQVPGITSEAAGDLKPHLDEVTAAVADAVADLPDDERPAAAAAAVKTAREQFRPQSSPPPAPSAPVAPAQPTPTGGGEPTRITHTSTERTTEQFIADRETGELLSPEDWQQQNAEPNPVAWPTASATRTASRPAAPTATSTRTPTSSRSPTSASTSTASDGAGGRSAGPDRPCGQSRRRTLSAPYAAAVAARFLNLDDVAAELAISRSQVYALVRNGDLPAMKVGGRGQWRVERARLEAYIEAAHAETQRFVTEHPFTGQADDEEPG